MNGGIPFTRVLLIDDDPAIHHEVDEALANHSDLYVIHAQAAGDGIRLALDQRPDLILLDINMPSMDGFKVCRLLRENGSTRHIPILFLTVDTNVRHLERAFDCGATDFLRKPVNEIELRSRIRVALRNKQLVEMLTEQARVDALTGLHNRVALDDALAAAIALHDRKGTPLGFLFFDIDRFKAVNDTHGHGVGDGVLQAVGRALQEGCRAYDTPCRFGGDEFAVVIGQCEGREALSVAKRLLAAIAATDIRSGEGSVRVTTSAGLVTTATIEGGALADEIFKGADTAVYAAKARGHGLLVVGDVAG